MSKQQRLVPGAVVSVPWFMGIRHVGLVTDTWLDDGPTVISNSKAGGVIEQTWTQFCAGHRAKFEAISGSRCGQHAVAWARRQLGSSYSLFADNCEHFVREALGAKRESPQLQSAFVGLGLLAFAVALTRR
jgi:hypothetical protein